MISGVGDSLIPFEIILFKLSYFLKEYKEAI